MRRSIIHSRPHPPRCLGVACVALCALALGGCSTSDAGASTTAATTAAQTASTEAATASTAVAETDAAPPQSSAPDQTSDAADGSTGVQAAEEYSAEHWSLAVPDSWTGPTNPAGGESAFFGIPGVGSVAIGYEATDATIESWLEDDQQWEDLGTNNLDRGTMTGSDGQELAYTMSDLVTDGTTYRSYMVVNFSNGYGARAIFSAELEQFEQNFEDVRQVLMTLHAKG